jgi:Bacteriocin-protection, YdeI or OmpD-Associated/Domain of unknown function (DUF1905)
MRFHTTLLLAGKTATGFEVPEEIVTGLGSGKRPAVRVTIKSQTYRTTVAPMGGVFMIGVSAENREAAGVRAGDELDIVVELDTEPREVDVPADLAVALDRDPVASRFFDTLSYSNKQGFVLPIVGAKTAETRERRIAKAVSSLHDGRTR